jgi:hypothetical protein
MLRQPQTLLPGGSNLQFSSQIHPIEQHYKTTFSSDEQMQKSSQQWQPSPRADESQDPSSTASGIAQGQQSLQEQSFVPFSNPSTQADCLVDFSALDTIPPHLPEKKPEPFVDLERLSLQHAGDKDCVKSEPDPASQYVDPQLLLPSHLSHLGTSLADPCSDIFSAFTWTDQNQDAQVVNVTNVGE